MQICDGKMATVYGKGFFRSRQKRQDITLNGVMIPERTAISSECYNLIMENVSIHKAVQEIIELLHFASKGKCHSLNVQVNTSGKEEENENCLFRLKLQCSSANSEEFMSCLTETRDSELLAVLYSMQSTEDESHLCVRYAQSPDLTTTQQSFQARRRTEDAALALHCTNTSEKVRRDAGDTTLHLRVLYPKQLMMVECQKIYQYLWLFKIFNPKIQLDFSMNIFENLCASDLSCAPTNLCGSSLVICGDSSYFLRNTAYCCRALTVLPVCSEVLELNINHEVPRSGRHGPDRVSMQVVAHKVSTLQDVEGQSSLGLVQMYMFGPDAAPISRGRPASVWDVGSVSGGGGPDVAPISHVSQDTAPVGCQGSDAAPVSGGGPDDSPISEGSPDTEPIRGGGPDTEIVRGGGPDAASIRNGGPDATPVSGGVEDNPLAHLPWNTYHLKCHTDMSTRLSDKFCSLFSAVLASLEGQIPQRRKRNGFILFIHLHVWGDGLDTARSKSGFLNWLCKNYADILKFHQNEVTKAISQVLGHLLDPVTITDEKTGCYAKAIPHVSKAISYIVSRSSDENFRRRCFNLLQINSSRDVESKVREKLWDISGSNTCGVKGQAEVKGRGDGNSFSSLNSRLPTQGITTTATIGLDIDPEPDVDQRMSVGSDSPCSRLDKNGDVQNNSPSNGDGSHVTNLVHGDNASEADGNQWDDLSDLGSSPYCQPFNSSQEDVTESDLQDRHCPIRSYCDTYSPKSCSEEHSNSQHHRTFPEFVGDHFNPNLEQNHRNKHTYSQESKSYELGYSPGQENCFAGNPEDYSHHDGVISDSQGFWDPGSGIMQDSSLHGNFTNTARFRCLRENLEHNQDTLMVSPSSTCTHTGDITSSCTCQDQDRSQGAWMVPHTNTEFGSTGDFRGSYRIHQEKEQSQDTWMVPPSNTLVHSAGDFACSYRIQGPDQSQDAWTISHTNTQVSSRDFRGPSNPEYTLDVKGQRHGIEVNQNVPVQSNTDSSCPRRLGQRAMDDQNLITNHQTEGEWTPKLQGHFQDFKEQEIDADARFDDMLENVQHWLDEF